MPERQIPSSFSSRLKESFGIGGSICSAESDAELEEIEEQRTNNTMALELAETPSYSTLMISDARSEIGQKNPSKEKKEDKNGNSTTYIARSSVEVNLPPPKEPPRSREYVQDLNQVGEHIDIMHRWIKHVLEASLSLRPSRNGLKNTILKSTKSSEKHIPRDVGVTHEFEHSLEWLTSYQEKAFLHHQSDLDIVVENISKIPGLMRTIMLIEDDADRKRILSYPIVKCAMMKKCSLMRQISDDNNDNISRSSRKGSWLIDLLESGENPLKKKVIEYLEIISNISAMDLVPNSLKKAEKSLSSFESRFMFEHGIKFLEQRRELYTAFTKMSHFIPTLLLLSDEQMEDAAGMGVIKYVVEWNLFQPIGESSILLDLASYIIVIFSMQLLANAWVEEVLGENPEETVGDALLSLFATLGVVYWCFRRLCEAISIISISPKAYLKHSVAFWNLLDMVSLILSMHVYILTLMSLMLDISLNSLLNEYWLAMISILVGILWINLLGLFKVLNKKFATMLLAVSKIVRDISMFLVIVVISILANGDMLNVYFSTNSQVCPGNFNSTEASENASAFCTKQRFTSYMTVYNMYLGDIHWSDFSETPLTNIVYLGLTFFGVIIMLNVIIAIVCDSYAESNEQSEKLYGSARLSYAAAIIAYEDLIKPKSLRGLSWKHIFLQLFVHFFQVTIMIIALAIILLIFAIIVLSMTHWVKWLLAILATVPALLTWFIFFSYQITGWDDRTDGKFVRLRKFQNNRFINLLFFRPIKYVTRMVLGTNEFSNTSEFDLGNNNQGILAPVVTSSNEYQNEIKISEKFEVHVKENLSIMKKQHKMHHNEMNQIKHDVEDIKSEMKCLRDGLKDGFEEIKDMIRNKFEEYQA